MYAILTYLLSTGGSSFCTMTPWMLSTSSSRSDASFPGTVNLKHLGLSLRWASSDSICVWGISACIGACNPSVFTYTCKICKLVYIICTAVLHVLLKELRYNHLVMDIVLTLNTVNVSHLHCRCRSVGPYSIDGAVRELEPIWCIKLNQACY